MYGRLWIAVAYALSLYENNSQSSADYVFAEASY